MVQPWLVAAAMAVVVVIGAVWAMRPLRRFGRQVQWERACEAFRLQRDALEAKFIAAARATGKPRGLTWQECKFEQNVQFVRDRQSGDIAALVGATIAFQAIAGSDMEDNANVGLLRNASAVFFFHKGHWSTVGKAVFNMNPDEAIERFKEQYERVG